MEMTFVHHPRTGGSYLGRSVGLSAKNHCPMTDEDPAQCVTVLRQPVNRIVSLRRFCPGTINLPCLKIGEFRDLEQWLDNNREARNGMVRRLSGMPVVADREPDETDLSLAIRRIEQMLHVGLTEALNRSVEALGGPIQQAPRNASKPWFQPTDDQREMIADYNLLDQQLYDHALTLGD
jgi:hypothetical protein